MSDIVRAWRIVNRRHIRTAMSGDGARHYGGRWTSPGVPAVYASQSLSLALLEVIVHVQVPSLFAQYAYFTLDIPAHHLLTFDASDLPDGWRASPPSPKTQRIGDRWRADASTPALRVPSALLPMEFNVVVNVEHDGFGDVAVGGPFALDVDPRVWGRPTAGL